MAEAMHEGWCHVGDDKIEVGDEITRDEDGNWAHAECVERDRQGQRRVQS